MIIIRAIFEKMMFISSFVYLNSHLNSDLIEWYSDLWNVSLFINSSRTDFWTDFRTDFWTEILCIITWCIFLDQQASNFSINSYQNFVLKQTSKRLVEKRIFSQRDIWNRSYNIEYIRTLFTVYSWSSRLSLFGCEIYINFSGYLDWSRILEQFESKKEQISFTDLFLKWW